MENPGLTPTPPHKGQKMPVPRGRYKARGIVLHALKYGERQLIIHIFTARYGRLSYITKITPRNSSRSLYQPLFVLDFDAWSGRGELHHIEQPRMGLGLTDLPFDIVKSSIALFLSELLYRLIHEGEPDPALYRFVETSIARLDTLTQGVANFHLWFLVHLTRYMGYAPQDNYVEGYALDYRNGLYTPELPQHTLAMPPAEATLFHTLDNCTPDDLARIGLAREQRVSILERLTDLYGFHTDAIYSVNSLRILSEIFCQVVCKKGCFIAMFPELFLGFG